MSQQSTEELPLISIDTKVDYLPAQSLPNELRFVFSYTITISNNSPETIQLLTRHWTITDANGDITTVDGEGVIGQTPFIPSQGSYTYTSGSMFKTPVGTMQGYYQMKKNNGHCFQVDIPVFRLVIPNLLH